MRARTRKLPCTFAVTTPCLALASKECDIESGACKAEMHVNAGSDVDGAGQQGGSERSVGPLCDKIRL